MDLAQIIELISHLKRDMCSVDLDLTDDQIFALDLLDPDVVVRTAVYVRGRAWDHGTEPPSTIAKISLDLEGLRVALEGSPRRPSDAEMCKRYARGEINVRTLVAITGWDIDQIVDRCAETGEVIS